jgi:hypothetical protein
MPKVPPAETPIAPKAVLSGGTGFGVLRVTPFAVPIRADQAATVPPLPSTIAPGPWTKTMSETIWKANEGLLDSELASGNPAQAWLDRYLTPPSQ